MNLDGKTHPKSSSTKERIKKKSQAIFYKCKKPEHLKSKCPKLEKAKDKKNPSSQKERKVSYALRIIWMIPPHMNKMMRKPTYA